MLTCSSYDQKRGEGALSPRALGSHQFIQHSLRILHVLRKHTGTLESNDEIVLILQHSSYLRYHCLGSSSLGDFNEDSKQE